MNRLTMQLITLATSILCGALAAQKALAVDDQPFVMTATSAPTSQLQVITSADQLPRRNIQLDKLPSQYLDGSRAELKGLAQLLEANLNDDLSKFDIQDAATLRAYYGALLSLAQFNADWGALPKLVERLKALQDKPGPRAMTGTLAQLVAEQQMAKHDNNWVKAEVTKRYSAMNWDDVSHDIKALKGQLELVNPSLTSKAALNNKSMSWPAI